ncbi:AraC family transcriptional regulator [Filimonas effusa]|uniref:AraC family transcriptional regulator n=1 Tax=Filimonas effusa TaxID=2508721 RepID=A0A4Q1DC29_9BACT|nr:AraC family transcriptional regulator [Filimonas effusa]RXK87007.1 AraC family transcriptional regulator [Filimonas effusa]
MDIVSATFGPLNFKPQVPAELAYLKIPGSKALTAIEPFAKVFYQKYETDDYCFWLTAYHPNADQEIYIHREGPYIGFKVVLKQHIRYRYDLGELYIKQGQFVFAHCPVIDTKFNIKSGHEYFVFDMCLNLDFIKSVGIENELLGRFLRQIEEGKRAFLLDTMVQSGALLLDAIEYLLGRPADKKAASAVLTLLIQVAEQRNGIDLPEYKIERMYQAREIIRQDVARHVSNHDLARMVGTNSRDLKTDFVKVFAMPPCQFLQYERIKTAKTLLIEEPQMSVDEIAVKVGFRNSAAFDPAFKGNVGVTPSFWRKRGGNI